MSLNKQITHDGFVESFDDEIINVRIITNAACVSCSAKSSCSVSETEEKIVEVRNTGQHNYRVGEPVVVTLDQNQGFVAVFIAYFLPFLILVSTLIALLYITDSEGLAGIAALGMLIPYYILVYLFRRKIRNRFSFKIK